VEQFPKLTARAKSKIAEDYDTPGKRREIFARWLPEYEASRDATETEARREEEPADVAATIAASLGLSAPK
jgi:hypothetical protein